ncbi:MAG TPA: type VI secretion system-associated FHA domain protein, partial [Anaeromyxobacteraceae bacterium]
PDLLSGGAPQPLDLPPLDFPDPAVEQALTDAALDLDLLYASYRGSWEHLRGRLAELLQGLEGPARAAASRRLAEKYDALAAERQYQELAGLPAPAAGAAPPAAGSAPAAAPPAGSSDVERLLQTFAESYLPASASVAGREPAQRLLDRVAEALETFCRSYVEMRKGYEEFGKEMGVRTVQGDGPIQRARDHRALMAYLLDPAHQGRGRDLQSAFADLMVHQVALLNGVVEGAKALLARLGPEAISAENPGGMWPMKAQTLWKAFEARHQELVEEEAAISDLLFGREFARAYTAMVGGRSGEEDEDGGGRKRRRR